MGQSGSHHFINSFVSLFNTNHFQVRVVHGKEPNHFMAIFGGKLIIFEGGKAGWGQGGDDGPGDTYLLHIRGTSQYNTKAEQVCQQIFTVKNYQF